MAYVFDTSSLIGAWFRTYPPDLFPHLWDNMDGLARRGNLLVPEEVLHELKVQDDDLLTWVKDRADLVVISTSRAVMLEARAILVDYSILRRPAQAGVGPIPLSLRSRPPASVQW